MNEILKNESFAEKLEQSPFDTSKSLTGLENYVEYSTSSDSIVDKKGEKPNFIKTRLEIAKFMMNARKVSDEEFFCSYNDLWYKLKSMENTIPIYGSEISQLQDKVDKVFFERAVKPLKEQVDSLIKIKNARLGELTKKFPELKKHVDDSGVFSILFLDIYFAIQKLEDTVHACWEKFYEYHQDNNNPFDTISRQISDELRQVRIKGSTILKSDQTLISDISEFLDENGNMHNVQSKDYANIVAGFMDGQYKSGEGVKSYLNDNYEGATIFSYILMYNHLPDIIDPYSYILSNKENYPNLIKNIELHLDSGNVVKIQLNEKLFASENVETAISEMEKELSLLKTDEDYLRYHFTKNPRFKDTLKYMSYNQNRDKISMDARPWVDGEDEQAEIVDLIIKKYTEIKTLNASTEARNEQSENNSQPSEIFEVRDTDYFHGKKVNRLLHILNNGLTAPRFRKINAFQNNIGGSDTWRHNYIDMSHFEESDNTKTVEKLFSHKVVYDYASILGDVLMVYNATGEEKKVVGNYNASIVWNNHQLTPVGLASTNIRAIILGKDGPDVERKTKQSIVDYGAYIPVYNRAGNLIFGFDDYQALFAAKQQ